MTNLDSILKCRDMTAEKGPYSQTYGFSIVMYGYESWTIRLSTEELKSLVMKVKKESEKLSLKLNILRWWHPVPSMANR